MNRKLIVSIHLYLAAFFAPAVLLVAISGGLYLIGIKGDVEEQPIYNGPTMIDTKSDSLKADISALLQDAGVRGYNYEYVKVKGTTLDTRPTSREHYRIKLQDKGVEVFFVQPNLQSKMIELHKGHGPSSFKTFQKFFALALVLVMISGFWLGVLNAGLRKTTLLAASIGAVIFALIAL